MFYITKKGRNKMKFKNKILIFILAVLFSGIGFRTAFAVDSPKHIKGVETNILRADWDGGKYKDLSINFKFTETVKAGDYFYIYQKGLLDLSNNYNIEKDGKIVAVMKAEKSNKSKAEYWRYTEDPADLAKFDKYTIDEAIPWVLYKVKFTDEVKQGSLTEMNISIKNNNARDAYPIISRSYTFDGFLSVNDKEVLRQPNIKINPRLIQNIQYYKDEVGCGNVTFNSKTLKGNLNYGYTTLNSWSGYKVVMKMAEDSSLNFLAPYEKTETNGTNFIRTAENRVSADGIVMINALNNAKIKYLGIDNKNFEIHFLEQNNPKRSSGLYPPVVLNPSRISSGDIDFKKGVINNIKYHIQVVANDGAVVYERDCVAQGSIQGVITDADITKIKKELKDKPLPETVNPKKDEVAKEINKDEPTKSPQAPNTGFEKSQNLIIPAFSILGVVTVLFFRKKSKLKL